MIDVKGPYKYEGDVHPCFRITDDAGLLACVYDNDGRGYERATEIKAALTQWRIDQREREEERQAAWVGKPL